MERPKHARDKGQQTLGKGLQKKHNITPGRGGDRTGRSLGGHGIIGKIQNLQEK